MVFCAVSLKEGRLMSAEKQPARRAEGRARRMSSADPATFDLDEIEKALMRSAMGVSPGYHTLGYAWEALKRCGHSPAPENEKAFEKARSALISNPT